MLQKFYPLFQQQLDSLALEAPPRIVAVSKTKPVADILALQGLGQTWFGENYYEELVEKFEQLHRLKVAVKFSFIGTLQSNKIQRLVQCCAEIQTVTSRKHLRYIANYAKSAKKTPFPVFIQCNFWQESSKAGCSLEEAHVLQEYHQHMGFPDQIDLQGLMGIPPKHISDHAGENPKPYQDFVDAARQIGAGHASLGMSADWETAAKSGSRCLRIGSMLFGARH